MSFLVDSFVCFIFSVPKNVPPSPKMSPKIENGLIDEETLAANRLKFAQKMNKKKQDTK